MTNPHPPFTYDVIQGQINTIGDLGDKYEADVYQADDGWVWSARYTSPDEGDGLTTGTDAPGGRGLATEAEAVAAAVAWLRARCVEAYGSCG